jgi:hypothetical protein
VKPEKAEASLSRFGNILPRRRRSLGRSPAARPVSHRPQSFVAGLLISLPLAGPAAEGIDLSTLPPAATQPIEFVRDVKPIFADHCLKCHSDEKPRSSFRLTSRESALKGGEHGVDIIPGDSAKSPLIQYVARLMPDMEMPPEGRGAPLSSDEIGRLRAWIDQGAIWETITPPPRAQVAAVPVVGWTSVSGDQSKFRELWWQPEGWNGGLETFEFTDRPRPDSQVTVAGHALLNDYRITLSSTRENLGFTSFGWSQFRKYYDDTGGYYPLFNPSSYSLNQDLHMDVGKAWASFGLTLPNLPRLVLGYEYQYRDGNESTLQWGPVSSGTNYVNIYPGYKEISERVHILKFDLDYDLSGFALSDNFRGEWYRLGTVQINEDASDSAFSSPAFSQASQASSYFQGANAFHVEKHFADWFFGAGGYLYSKLNADGSSAFSVINPEALDQNPTLVPVLGWNAQQIELSRESHVFSLSALLGPWQGFNLSLGVQNEWTRQTGFGTADVVIALPFAPFIFPAAPPETVQSDLDQSVFSQEVGLRYTKIPLTTLFADARFQEADLGKYEQEDGGTTPFLRNTDEHNTLEDFRVGFNTSPWRRISLSGSYRHYDSNTDYDNLQKFVASPGNEGYPAFFNNREMLSNEAQGRLSLQWNSWLKTSLAYQWLDNDYHTTTEPVTIDPATGLPADISPGTAILAGTYQAHIASLNATLTPWTRLFLSGTLAYQNARTVTFANDSPAIAPYAGDIYSVIFSGNYALNDRTSVIVSYAYSQADFAQDNLEAGLPLGITYHQHGLQAGLRRQLGKGSSLGLQYRFYLYNEPSSGGINNFQAQGVFATFACRWP